MKTLVVYRFKANLECDRVYVIEGHVFGPLAFERVTGIHLRPGGRTRIRISEVKGARRG